MEHTNSIHANINAKTTELFVLFKTEILNSDLYVNILCMSGSTDVFEQCDELLLKFD